MKMSSLKKRMKDEGVMFAEFYDHCSQKGHPRDGSVVVSVAWKREENGEIVLGTAVKIPHDIYKRKIGRAIAYRDYKKRMKFIGVGGNDLELIIDGICIMINNVSNPVRKRIEQLKYELYYKIRQGEVNGKV
jgi:mannitol/fructose-specific phosphotransferase system IIA component (Ntr-type)